MVAKIEVDFKKLGCSSVRKRFQLEYPLIRHDADQRWSRDQKLWCFKLMIRCSIPSMDFRAPIRKNLNDHNAHSNEKAYCCWRTKQNMKRKVYFGTRKSRHNGNQLGQTEPNRGRSHGVGIRLRSIQVSSTWSITCYQISGSDTQLIRSSSRLNEKILGDFCLCLLTANFCTTWFSPRCNYTWTEMQLQTYCSSIWRLPLRKYNYHSTHFLLRDFI